MSPYDQINEYASSVINTISYMSRKDIVEVLEILTLARSKQRNVFVCGNGGSAATADHFVNDLNKMASDHYLRFKAVSLCSNVAWMTALANDDGYDHIFSGQLWNLAKAKDILICISGSGQSRSILEAIDLANKIGVLSISILGTSICEAERLSHKTIIFPAATIAQQEDGHLMICHILATLLKDSLTP